MAYELSPDEIAVFEPHAKQIDEVVKIDPLTLIAIISLIVNILRLWMELGSEQEGQWCRARRSFLAKSLIIKKHPHLPYRFRRRIAMAITDHLSNLDKAEADKLNGLVAGMMEKPTDA